jgi:hypothetical protein
MFGKYFSSKKGPAIQRRQPNISSQRSAVERGEARGAI